MNAYGKINPKNRTKLSEHQEIYLKVEFIEAELEEVIDLKSNWKETYVSSPIDKQCSNIIIGGSNIFAFSKNLEISSKVRSKNQQF